MSFEHDKVTVVLVENNAQLLKHLQKTLGLIDQVELVNTSLLAQEALEVVRDLKPLVALVEYNLPDMNGINLTEIMRREFPGTQVIIISQDNYTDIVLQAVRAGACDFITHDVSVKELNDVIVRAATLATVDRSKISAFASIQTPDHKRPIQAAPTGKMVAVYSAKGGIGTTTVAANLALALIDRDRDARVVIVDGSMQYGDIHLMFNELGQTSVMDLVPRVYELDTDMVENVMLFNRATGISIMPAPPRPEFAEKITGEAFSRILEFMRRHYDYIVLNTDSYLSDAVLAALDAGEVIVLVTAQSINAIRNTRLFLDLWSAFGMTKDRIHLVLNRHDPTSPITTDLVGERLKFQVNTVLPDDDEAARKADALGQPILRSTRDSAYAKAIKSLAEQVAKRAEAVEKSEEPRMRLFVAA
ncbi:MAG TPA: response regulator [Bellilinea sp.]